MSHDDEYLSIDKRLPETLIKRLLTHAAGEYGTPHGQMMLRGDLTKAQYAACKWFDELYRSYLKAIDGPKGIRTSTGQRIDPGHAPDPFSPIGWDIATDERNTVRAFDSARMAGMACGEPVFKTFWWVVIDNHEATSRFCRSKVILVAAALDKHRTRSWKSRRKSK